MYLVYSLLTLLVFVVVSPYFAYQAIRYKKYIGSLRQRLGFLPLSFNFDGEESIWIHAVSVGEALTARALAADLKARYPRLRLFLSTTTIAGQEVARHSLSNVDAIFYFPFDWTLIVRRTLHLVRPRLFVMMETEIWPNLLHECRRRGASTARALGSVSLIRASARSTAASSPRIVLPATMTVRCEASRKNRSTRSRGLPWAVAAGSSSESNFRLPVTVTCAGSAPSSTRRRADSSLWTQKRSTSASTRRKNGRTIR